MNDTLAALVIAHHVVLLRLLDQMDPKARQRVIKDLLVSPPPRRPRRIRKLRWKRKSSNNSML